MMNYRRGSEREKKRFPWPRSNHSSSSYEAIGYPTAQFRHGRSERQAAGTDSRRKSQTQTLRLPFVHPRVAAGIVEEVRTSNVTRTRSVGLADQRIYNKKASRSTIVVIKRMGARFFSRGFEVFGAVDGIGSGSRPLLSRALKHYIGGDLE